MRHELKLLFELEYPTQTGARYRVSEEDPSKVKGIVIGVVGLHKDWLYEIGHETIPESFEATILLPEPVSVQERIAAGGVKLMQHHHTKVEKPKEAGTVEVDGQVVYTPSRGHLPFNPPPPKDQSRHSLLHSLFHRSK